MRGMFGNTPGGKLAVYTLDVCCVDCRDKTKAIRSPDQRSTGWPALTIPHALSFWKKR